MYTYQQETVYMAATHYTCKSRNTTKKWDQAICVTLPAPDGGAAGASGVSDMPNIIP